MVPLLWHAWCRLKCGGRTKHRRICESSADDLEADGQALGGEAARKTAIAAGGVHSCAVTTAGDVLCWGSTGHGQMNKPGTTDSLIPTAVTGL